MEVSSEGKDARWGCYDSVDSIDVLFESVFYRCDDAAKLHTWANYLASFTIFTVHTVHPYQAYFGILCLGAREDDSTAMSRSEFRAKSNKTCTMLGNSIERNQ